MSILPMSKLIPNKKKHLENLNSTQKFKNRQQLDYLEVRYSDNLDDSNYQRNTLKVQYLKSVDVATKVGDIEYYRYLHSQEYLAQSRHRSVGDKQPTEQQIQCKMGRLPK